MAFLTNRIKEVQEELGRVLDNPKSFGLSECPKQLSDALTKMRRSLMEEWIERIERVAADDGLTVELSQDADAQTCISAGDATAKA